MTRASSSKQENRPSYARLWVLVLLWVGALLVLSGASLLFSQIRQVDWRICAALSLLLLLALVFLLIRSLLTHPSPLQREAEFRSVREEDER